MGSRASVFSRFRLAAWLIVLGVGLLGAAFYGAVTSRLVGQALGQTLGPYSDALAEHAFANRSPEVWRQMARRHGVVLVVELPDGMTVAFDDEGRPVSADAAPSAGGRVRAVRTAPDGTRLSLYWRSPAEGVERVPLLLVWLATLALTVGLAFLFLQRQLRPLRLLHDAVAAVAKGDFDARAPVVREDEIGHVATAFNEMTRRVGTMIDDRERLLADVSHELRSPLARMKVALEFVSPGPKRDGMIRDLREMESLIAALLEREALRHGTGRLGGAPVDLAAIAGDVVGGFENRAPGVVLSTRGEAPLIGDAALLRLLVRNLVDNAIKFSTSDSAPATVRVEVDDSHVVLRVADDGPGIPAGEERRLFEPFVKLDPARGHHGGYGLGLNLCRRIVEVHGGSIRLLPREARGTEAVVRLPRRRAVETGEGP